jgi:type II secretory pathway component GspD/PulD (secretin)
VAIANSVITPGYAGVNSATPGTATLAGQNDVAARFTSITDVRTAIFGADALSLVLSALQKTEDALVVSNPKVIVANEEKALIDMAQKEPYVTVERKTDGTGDNTTYTYSTKMEVIPGDAKENKLLPYIEQAFFTYGIKLEVTPRINNASNITVTVTPTLSSLLEYYTPAGEGSTRYPIIQSKHVRTVFSLGDGQTAVIGGLTQTRDKDKVKKVPLLGDIPLLGKYLFSHTEKVKSQVETIIFVTVGIVDPEKPQMALAVPEGASLVHKHVDAEGRLIKWTPPAEMDPEKAELVPDVVEE